MEQKEMIERMELQQKEQAAAAKRAPGIAASQSSAMSFDPINEEEGEDGESG